MVFMCFLKRNYGFVYSFLQTEKVLFNFAASLTHFNNFLLKYSHNFVTSKHEVQAENEIIAA